MQNDTIRVIMPQWQGGNLEAYSLGAELLAFLSPKTNDKIINIPISPYNKLKNENGIMGRTQIKRQINTAFDIINEHSPQKIITLGGDCLVSLAPFSYLSEKYKENFAILWLDAHPDIMTPKEYANSHAHVLGALMRNGDKDLTSIVKNPVNPSKVLIAGINNPTPYENEFLKKHNICTYSPKQIKEDNCKKLENWIKKENIKHLAIHFDLDVLNYHNFRSLYFSNPNAKDGEFDGIAKGKLEITEVLNLIKFADINTQIVGLSITEHLPWDAINLKAMLNELPLLK